jgi:hypothetical protein
VTLQLSSEYRTDVKVMVHPPACAQYVRRKRAARSEHLSLRNTLISIVRVSKAAESNDDLVENRIVSHDNVDIEGRFGQEIGNRGATDMLNTANEVAESFAVHRLKRGELYKPIWIVST